MAQAATLLISPTRKHADEEKGVLQMAAPLLTGNLEDLRLAERIERALRATGYGTLRAIEVSVNARIVHLAGRVPSYYLKQIAQATALAVPGAHQIHNGLDVVPPN
jgi:osmotically-inducible protein OsmY